MNLKRSSHKINIYFLIVLVCVFLISHFIIWLIASSFHSENFFSIFTHTDATRYAEISTRYYTPEFINGKLNDTFAFFPLWPLFVHSLGYFIKQPHKLIYCIIGAGASVTLLLAFIIFVYKSKFGLNVIKPQTWFGWFLFLFSPTSYIFHTNHTESLFLILSWLSFASAIKGQGKTASILAGICSLTKNQGVITSFIIALINTAAAQNNKKVLSFIKSALLSFSFFILWPIFQYLKTGDFLAFTHVQNNWQHANGILDYLWTWLYNFRYVVQLIHGIKSLRAILFYIGIAVAIYLIFYKKFTLLIHNKKINLSFYFGIYIFLCSALLPLQGYLENTFRFHLILFSFWFVLGDLLYKFIYSLRSLIFFYSSLFLLLASLFSLNLWMTYLYGLGHWAY